MEPWERDGIPEAHYRKRWWTLSVLTLSLILVVLANSVLNVAIPTLVREIGATGRDLQWIVDAYALVFGGLLLTMGALGDRYGRRWALLIGLTVFALASGAAVWAETANHLIAIRALMGIGAALVMPATLSILTTVFPREERGKAMGIWAGFAGVGGAIGPVVGGYLLEHFSWPSIFLINLPVVGIGLLGGWFIVPPSRDPNQTRLDPPGAALSIVALTALLFAIIEGPVRGWSSWPVVGGFVLAAATGVAFVWWEWRTEHPMLPMPFFRERGFSVGTTTIAMTFFAMFAMFFVLTQYLQFVQDYTALEAGIRTLPFAAGMILGAPQSARLAELVSTRRVVAAGLAIVAVALVWYGLYTVDTPYWQLGIGFFLGGLGMGLAMAPATTVIMDSIPGSKAGVGSAVNDTAREIGGALGIAVLGSVLNASYRGAIEDSASSQLSPPMLEVAGESVGAALAVAAQLGGEAGAGLAAAARQAYVDAMAWSFWAAAVMVIGAAILVLLRLPELAHHRRPSAPGDDAPPGPVPAAPAAVTSVAMAVPEPAPPRPSPPPTPTLAERLRAGDDASMPALDIREGRDRTFVVARGRAARDEATPKDNGTKRPRARSALHRRIDELYEERFGRS